MKAIALAAPFRQRRPLQWGLLALLLGGLTVVIGQSSGPPLVNLSSEPLYMSGARTKANLTLALSVERPTVGQTYAGNSVYDPYQLKYVHDPANDYNPAKTYLGYFDGGYCYQQTNGQPFKASKQQTNGQCGGNGFHGNFMNWATSSAIDIMRMGLTGGNRVVDNAGGGAETVLERAYLPDDFYRSDLFQGRWVSKAAAQGLVDKDVYKDIPAGGAWIYNCKNRVYFADKLDMTGLITPPAPAVPNYWDPGNCDSPFNIAPKKNPNLIGGGTDQYYEVKVQVCDATSAKGRPMTFDPNTQRWSGLCFQYPNGKYKPVGQLQMNADAVRVSIFGYLQDNQRDRYGGVLRAPLKYVGPKKFDANFNLIPGVNGQAEWDEQTGVLVDDPQASDKDYGNQGFKKSGVINYLNKFGTLDPNAMGVYKVNDPLGELYYEALRYLQGKQPTPKALDGFNGTPSQVTQLKENFPAYSTWVDPFKGFVDGTGTGTGAGKSCLRNSIAVIADVFTNSDREIPGNKVVPKAPDIDFARLPETNPALDVMFWTRVVGSYETQTASTTLTYSYRDSLNRPQTAVNLPTANTGYATTQALAYADIMTTGADDTASYYIAGLAYWANTQIFRTDFPKARIKTYAIDVDERSASSTQVPAPGTLGKYYSGPAPQWRQTRQLHLAAKYGGFDDGLPATAGATATGAGQTGNPYADGSNSLWQGANGDAKNYFLASDAQKFLDSIADLFSRVVEESATIAGGAISSQRVTSSSSADVFFAKFNPVSNFWSGRVLKYGVKLINNQLQINAQPTWEAGAQMMADLKLGIPRRIIVGPSLGNQGKEPATDFLWTSLSPDHKKALNTLPNGTTDPHGRGQHRLEYLRGDQTKEIGANPPGPFRTRDIPLGDIVNSGLVFMGKPDFTTLGYMDTTNTVNYAAKRTFVSQHANRKSVIFANANDGMLHAFDDASGKEVFAYIPGFLVPKLSALSDPNYKHRSLADATPAVQDAYFRKAWRTALVSGVGGGAQGVYALDVSDPSNVTAASALWEFTDRDHPAMGNVLGAPQILKFRMENASSPSHTYKYFAVVASGVNSYALDGPHVDAVGNPSLFFFDMNYDPKNGPWQEGTNFWRIEMPQSMPNMAKGITGFTSTVDFARNTVNALYAGDLQGNMWKLDFSHLGFDINMTNDGKTNFNTFVFDQATKKPLFIAKDANGNLQPITGTPAVVHGYAGNKLVAFGTGKYLEASDAVLPLAPPASFYAVLDDRVNPVAGRAVLQAGTVGTTGTVTVPAFSLGTPGTSLPYKAGWYLDLAAAVGERQVSTIEAIGGKLVFGSIVPAIGACEAGGGNTYSVDALTGDGISTASALGVLAAPLVMQMGAPTLTLSGTTGRRTATEKFGVLTQGSQGLAVSSITQSFSYEVGRLSWRQINNYQDRKNQK